MWGVCGYGAVRTYTEGCDGMTYDRSLMGTGFPHTLDGKPHFSAVWLFNINIEHDIMLMPWPEVSA